MLAKRGWKIDLIVPRYSKNHIASICDLANVNVKFIELGVLRTLAAFAFLFFAGVYRFARRFDSKLSRSSSTASASTSALRLSIKNYILDFLLCVPIKKFAEVNFYDSLFAPLSHFRHFTKIRASKKVLHLPDLILLDPGKKTKFYDLFFVNVLRNIGQANVVAVTVPSQYVIDRELLKFVELKKYSSKFVKQAHCSNLLDVLVSNNNECSHIGNDTVSQWWSSEFIYYPTQDRPHKNIDAFVRAFRTARQKHPNLMLFLTAGRTSNDEAGVKDFGRLSFADHKQLIERSLFTVSASGYESALPFPASECVEQHVPFFCLDNPQYIEHVTSGAFFSNLLDGDELSNLCADVYANKAKILMQQREALKRNVSVDEFATAYEVLLRD